MLNRDELRHAVDLAMHDVETIVGTDVLSVTISPIEDELRARLVGDPVIAGWVVRTDGSMMMQDDPPGSGSPPNNRSRRLSSHFPRRRPARRSRCACPQRRVRACSRVSQVSLRAGDEV